MAKDPQSAQEQQKLLIQQTTADMEQIVKRYDRDGDTCLKLAELRSLRQAVAVHLEATQKFGIAPQRRPVFDALLGGHTPAAEEMLKRYDTDHDQKLSAAELAALAVALRKN